MNGHGQIVSFKILIFIRFTHNRDGIGAININAVLIVCLCFTFRLSFSFCLCLRFRFCRLTAVTVFSCFESFPQGFDNTVGAVRCSRHSVNT